MTPCVWLWEDSAGPGDPALRTHPEAPAVFVFDDAWLHAHPTSFKRLFFVYESLVELFAGRQAPSEIRRGTVVTEVFDFCRKHRAEEIHVTRSLSPAYRLYVELLCANFVVVEYTPDTLIPRPSRPPRRFMDLWKEARPRLLPEESPS